MKVKKENRVLTVDEADKTFYLSEGYDVVELNEESKEYDIVEEATGGKTYSVAEYNVLKAENDELKARIAELEKVETDWDEPSFDREAAKAELTRLGIEFKGNASNDTLKKLLEDSN